MKSINFIDEEECPKHSDSVDIPDFRDIYHGCMSREVSVKTLRASKRDMCYLVRKRINADEDVDSIEYILSFLHGDEDYHFKIKKEHKYFIFANRYFPSFKCVISHYMVSNIISNAHLEFGVVNRTITAVRESLRGQRCYLSENVSDDRMKELLCSDNAGSYLFRPRTDDNNQFVLMFFDGARIHKLKMDVRLVDKKEDSCDGDEPTDPVVVLVLGRNYFESWQEMVENFRMNSIVTVRDANCEDKLVKEVDVNRNANLIEQEDIYRKLKFNQALQQTDVYSIHGEVSYSEGSKIKWKTVYAMVDKDHGHFVLKNNKQVIELIRCKFIPIHYSVHQRYCFLLVYREQNGPPKNYYFSMLDTSSPIDRKENTEDTYAYRQYNLEEHDKEVYHSTEAEKDTDTLLCRAYDRWMTAVKRHCSNTKDDVANEENFERHSKLHRYNRRLKLQIGHSGGLDIVLTDADLCTVPSTNPSFTAPQAQFEVLVGNNVIATLLRKVDGPIQTILFQDLPSSIDDVSVSIRVKASRKKEFIKELCNYTIAHPKLVPRQALGLPAVPPHQTPEQYNLHTSSSYSLMNTSIPTDPPSSCGPITLDCYASIEYKELIILPFNNYKALSKYFMDNLRPIFSNTHFSTSFTNAMEMPEFKKLLNCFLYMAIWEKKQVDFLYIFFKSDLKEYEPSLYFRQNTSASKLFIDYVRHFASEWPVCSFVQLFEEIYINTELLVSPESNSEDSSPIEPSDNQSKSDETTFKCLTAALYGINENLKHCPLTLRQLFHKLQCEIKRRNPTTGESDEGLHYRLLNNLIMLRFFCAVLNQRGEDWNSFFCKISDNIRKKNDPRFKDFPKKCPPQAALNELLAGISTLILKTCKSKDRCVDDPIRMHEDRFTDDIKTLIREFRDRTLQQLNDDLTRPLLRAEMDRLPSQLERESTEICRLSLSRRFNDALEFLTKVQEEPTHFLKKKPDGVLSKWDLVSPDLSAIVDEINQKKSCSNTSLVERL